MNSKYFMSLLCEHVKKKKNLMSKMYFMGLSVTVIYSEGVKHHI
jgi:hypothetical protein